MAWRLVRSLDRLRVQVRAAAPRAAPPATAASTWGTIGDAAHSSTSDHSPHTYAALGGTPVVCAADFPHAPSLGLDGGVFAEALRRSRDPRIAYVIFNRRIFSSTTQPWTWRTYTGSDPHDTHWHVSTVHTAAADDTRDWAMPGTAGATGDDMGFNAQQKADAAFNLAPKVALDTDGTDNGSGSLKEFDNPLFLAIQNIRERLTLLEQRPVAGITAPTLEEIRGAVREELAAATVEARLLPGAHA